MNRSHKATRHQNSFSFKALPLGGLMGSHEMHFPLGHFLPLGSLSAAPVLGVWEGLAELGAGCTPQSTLPSAWHCGWASISATAPTGPCTNGSLLSSKERFRHWVMGVFFLLKAKHGNVGRHGHLHSRCCGQIFAPAHADRAVPISGSPAEQR